MALLYCKFQKKEIHLQCVLMVLDLDLKMKQSWVVVRTAFLFSDNLKRKTNH